MNRSMEAESAEPRAEFFEILNRLTLAVGRAAAHALKALAQVAAHQDIIAAQQEQIGKLGEAVRVHQLLFEAIAKTPPADAGPQLH